MKYNDRGASAILITIAVGFLLLGMAALAIDVGAGFNERRQDQSAADASVMAGGLEASFLTTNLDLVDEALAYARNNLDTTYSDAEWQALWQACTDANRPANFLEMPDPWGSGSPLQCISRSSSFVRVRVPDQVLDTSFGTFVGVNQLNVNAFAVARIGPAATNAIIVPYGLSGNSQPGEVCLGDGPSGIIYTPCSGPSAGAFGAIQSPHFGDFYGAVDCNPAPISDAIASQTALGVDHFIGTWPNPGGLVGLGSAHPGDGYVRNTLVDTNLDECTESGGLAIPVDGVPLNTIWVDTGFASAQPYEDGLVNESTFGVANTPSRLQQGSNPKRVAESGTGGNQEIWDLDNRGPWAYLISGAVSISECNPSTYTSALTPEQKAGRFHICLEQYDLGGETADLFSTDLDDSPRFAWAPQYWYEFSTTGLSPQPVYSFRMVFIGGTWFNCTGSSCAVVFYPDEDETSLICDPQGSNCATLRMGQFSAWYLPNASVPDEIRNSFPGGQTPFTPTLWR